MIAAGIMSFPAEPGKETLAGGCTSAQSDPPPFRPGAAHPAKPFYGPDEDPPEADISHVVGDGYVIVRYRPDLSPGQTDELRRWATDGTQGVIVAPKADQNE